MDRSHSIHLQLVAVSEMFPHRSELLQLHKLKAKLLLMSFFRQVLDKLHKENGYPSREDETILALQLHVVGPGRNYMWSRHTAKPEVSNQRSLATEHTHAR